MKRSELDAILKKSRLPEIPEESLKMFPRRLVARLKRAEPSARPTRHFLPRLAWAFGLAACIVIAFAIGHWSGRVETKDLAANDSLTNLKLIHETLAMFPQQVRAIVEDAHGVNLVLSDHGDVPVSTPIYLHICDGKQCVSVVTFSGQEIQVAGQKITVLADAQGGIILTGDQFVWSNTERNYADNHLKIEARNLNPTTSL